MAESPAKRQAGSSSSSLLDSNLGNASLPVGHSLRMLKPAPKLDGERGKRKNVTSRLLVLYQQSGSLSSSPPWALFAYLQAARMRLLVG